MGKKRRGHPDVEEVLARAWCYYCERDFEDLKLLISHQKAKHFKCERCGRRLNTAGGLSVHLNQVHKETLSQVENALPNRQGLEVEIFGMEGIPQDALDQHRNRIIQNFYQAQEDRRVATGNPVPGQGQDGEARKKIKLESQEEMLKRMKEFRKQKQAGADTTTANAVASGTYREEPQAPAPVVQPPPTFAGQQQPFGYPADQLPARPPSNTTGATGLPQRPPQGAGYWPQQGAVPGQNGDDIDQLIRMAEAGVKPAQPEADEGDKKGKKEKDKKGRMVYDDVDTSPEERMAALPRYAFVPEVGA